MFLLKGQVNRMTPEIWETSENNSVWLGCLKWYSLITQELKGFPIWRYWGLSGSNCSQHSFQVASPKVLPSLIRPHSGWNISSEAPFLMPVIEYTCGLSASWHQGRAEPTTEKIQSSECCPSFPGTWNLVVILSLTIKEKKSLFYKTVPYINKPTRGTAVDIAPWQSLGWWYSSPSMSVRDLVLKASVIYSILNW